MFEGKTVGLIVPCFNEAGQVVGVLDALPAFVDCIIVVDDASTDGTSEVVRRWAKDGAEGRLVLLRHAKNLGPGAAVVTGYRESLRRGLDVTAVTGGDGQMDPDELALLVGPVARGQTDYAKGNRFFYRGAWGATPKHRYLGNAFLSMLTKIASGYWHVADSQTGYTAISQEALAAIDLDKVYPGYGYPNDVLIRLNVYNMRVADVPIRPIYHVGEQSKMRLWKVIPTLSWLIFRRFWWRMKEKYVIRDFHPLVLFYLAATVTGVLSIGLFIRLILVWMSRGTIPHINALVWVFCLTSSSQFALFAMWFDMEMNRDLNANSRRVPQDAASCPLESQLQRKPEVTSPETASLPNPAPQPPLATTGERQTAQR